MELSYDHEANTNHADSLLSVSSTTMYCNPDIELMEKEQVEETINQLEKYVEDENISTIDAMSAWGKLSDCYARLNDEHKALCAALKPLQYRQPSCNSCCRIGHFYFHKQDWATAIFWYKLAVEASLKEEIQWDNPTQTWEPHLQLCVCYDKLGDYQKAYTHHKLAQNYMPEQPCILSNQTYFDQLFINHNLVKIPDCQLSILIPSVPERLPFLNQLLPELTKQALHQPVEILVNMDNKKSVIAKKRNQLLLQAKGKFSCFVDDDDRVSPNYVCALLTAIEQVPHADCIVFDVEVTIDGGPPKLTKFDKNYIYSQDEYYYYRKPNHAMCYAKRIASRHRFKETLIFGEDDAWGEETAADIRIQHRIDETLYFYDAVSKNKDWYHPVL